MELLLGAKTGVPPPGLALSELPAVLSSLRGTNRAACTERWHPNRSQKGERGRGENPTSICSTAAQTIVSNNDVDISVHKHVGPFQLAMPAVVGVTFIRLP